MRMLYRTKSFISLSDYGGSDRSFPEIQVVPSPPGSSPRITALSYASHPDKRGNVTVDVPDYIILSMPHSEHIRLEPGCCVDLKMGQALFLPCARAGKRAVGSPVKPTLRVPQ